MDNKKEKEELDDIGDGSVVSFYSISLKRVIEVLTSYIVTLLGGAAAYGFLSALIRIEQFLSRAIVGGFRVGIIRTFPRRNTDEQNAIITFLIPIIFFMWLFPSFLFILLEDYIIQETLLQERHSDVIYLFVISLLFLLPLPIISSIFKSHRQIRLSQLVWTILKSSIFLAGPLIPLIFYSNNLFSMWLSVTIMSTILLLISILLIKRYTKNWLGNPLRYRSVIKDFLYYCGDTFVSTIFGTVQHRGVFILMAIFISPTNAGLLSLSFIISGIVRWPLTSFNTIIPPVMTKVHKQSDKELLERLYERTSLIITYFSFPVFIIIVIFHTEIILLFSQQYKGNTIVLPILSLGQIVAIASGSVGFCLNMVDKQRENMLLMILMVIVFFPFVVYLTLSYGVVGLSVGSAGILILNNVFQLVLLKYSYGISPFTIRHLKLISLGILILSVGLIIHYNYSPQILILYCLISLTSFYYLSYKYVFEDNDIYLLKKCYESLTNVFSKETN